MKEGNKKLQVEVKQLTYDFIDCLSKATKYSKSYIIQKLLFTVTLNYWSDPEAYNKAWLEHYGQK